MMINDQSRQWRTAKRRGIFRGSAIDWKVFEKENEKSNHGDTEYMEIHRDGGSKKGFPLDYLTFSVELRALHASVVGRTDIKIWNIKH
jgi:hypothetical protein